jgi:hypothetical protein
MWLNDAIDWQLRSLMSELDTLRRCRTGAAICGYLGQGFCEVDVRQGRALRGEKRPDRGFNVQLQSARAEMGLQFRCRIVVVVFCVLLELLGIASVSAQEGVTRKAAGRSPPAAASMMPPRQCICTMEYNPVCGRTADGGLFVFSNPCRARCAGATILGRGLC